MASKFIIYSINSKANGFVAYWEGTNNIAGGQILNGWTVQQVINHSDHSATMIATHDNYGQRTFTIPKGSTGTYR